MNTPMKKAAAYRAFQIVYTILVLNFAIPAASYMIAPHLALGTVDQVNRALGGGPLHFPGADVAAPTAYTDAGQIWHMLAVGNVMTLAFMCALLLADLRRFYPVLPALVFLKGFSATYSAWLGVHHGVPAFLAIAALDGTSTVAMIVFARRALRALDGAPPPDGPWWVRAILLYPARIDRALAQAERTRFVPRTPNVWQVFLGVVRMQHRLIFRSDTVGTSVTRPMRNTRRARLLAHRPIRFPFLLWERAIAPLDLSGMASSPTRVMRHLLAAHHDEREFAYDLELLALHPGSLELLHDAVREVVDSDTRRSRWLRDLVVFEGYHEELLAAVTATLRGEPVLAPERASDPDASFRAYLSWCARQPATPAATLHALRHGDLRLA